MGRESTGNNPGQGALPDFKHSGSGDTEAAEAPAEEEETGGAAGEEERTPGCTVGKRGRAQHAADMKTQRGPAPVLCSPCFFIIIINV